MLILRGASLHFFEISLLLSLQSLPEALVVWLKFSCCSCTRPALISTCGHLSNLPLAHFPSTLSSRVTLEWDCKLQQSAPRGSQHTIQSVCQQAQVFYSWLQAQAEGEAALEQGKRPWNLSGLLLNFLVPPEPAQA